VVRKSGYVTLRCLQTVEHKGIREARRVGSMGECGWWKHIGILHELGGVPILACLNGVGTRTSTTACRKNLGAPPRIRLWTPRGLREGFRKDGFVVNPCSAGPRPHTEDLGVSQSDWRQKLPERLTLEMLLNTWKRKPPRIIIS
jgi:hypothetical protein